MIGKSHWPCSRTEKSYALIYIDSFCKSNSSAIWCNFGAQCPGWVSVTIIVFATPDWYRFVCQSLKFDKRSQLHYSFKCFLGGILPLELRRRHGLRVSEDARSVRQLSFLVSDSEKRHREHACECHASTFGKKMSILSWSTLRIFVLLMRIILDVHMPCACKEWIASFSHVCWLFGDRSEFTTLVFSVRCTGAHRLFKYAPFHNTGGIILWPRFKNRWEIIWILNFICDSQGTLWKCL